MELNRSNAIVVNPDIESLFKTPHQDACKVAARVEIMNCASVEDIENLQDRDTHTIRARNFIPVPPFLICTIPVSTFVNKGNTGKISLDVLSYINNFEDLHKDDSSFT